MLASTTAQLAIITLGAATSVAIARILGPGGTGSFALAANFLALATVVAGLALRQGIVFRVGSDRWQPEDAVRDLTIAAIIQGIAGALLALGVYELLSDGPLEGIPRQAAPFLAASIPLGLTWQFSWNLALAKDRYETFAAIQALPSLLALVTGVVLALTFGTTGAVIGLALGQALAGIIAWSWATRSAGGLGLSSPREAWSRLRPAISFGLQTWGAELMSFVNYRFDLFFLAAYAVTAQVGVYSVAATVTGIALVLPQAVATTLMSRTATLEGAVGRGEVDPGEADVSDARALRHAVILLPAAAATVALLLAVAVPLLYGEKFDEAVGLGFILLPGTLLLGLARVSGSVLVGRGNPRYPLYNLLLTVPPTVVAYILVIPESGATGAAIVSSLSYTLTAVISLVFFRRVTGIRWGDALVPRREDLRTYPEVWALAHEYGRWALGALRSGRANARRSSR